MSLTPIHRQHPRPAGAKNPPSRRGFSLVEAVVMLAVATSVLGLLVEAGQLLLKGLSSGERSSAELREAAVLIEQMREDLDGLELAAGRPDLGLGVTAGAVRFRRRAGGGSTEVRYSFEPGNVVREYEGRALRLGAGLIRRCAFTWVAAQRTPAARAPRWQWISRPEPDIEVRRICLRVDLAVGAPDPSARTPWLSFQTHLFPTWTNRRLTASWNRVDSL